MYDFGIKPKLCPNDDKATVRGRGVCLVKLDLRPLLAGDKLLSFDYPLVLDTDPEDTSSILYGVSFPSPMKVKGDITNTAGYMRMQLELSVDYTAECARCLRRIEGRFSSSLEKTVAPKSMLRDLDEDKLDDYCIIEDGFLDLDDEIRDQIEMEFPSRFLCKPDCLGMCPRCGKDLNEGNCDCPEHEVDPRLAPLQKWLDENKK